MTDETISENQVAILLHQLSEETGFGYTTIAWIHSGLLTLGHRHRTATKSTANITADEVCQAILRDTNALYKEPVADVLARLKITSSADIGKIVFGLVDKQLIQTSEGDTIADFDHIFTADTLPDYLAKNNIKKSALDIRTIYRKVEWTFYIVGTIIVIGSYTGQVPARLAWGGWTLAMIGFLMQFYKPPKNQRF